MPPKTPKKTKATNYDKLNNILLDDKGEVHDFDDKLFTEKLENQLLNTPSLFSSCKPTESILKQKNSQSVPTATCVSNCTQPPTYTLTSSSISSNVESYGHSSEIHNDYVKINHSAVGHDIPNLKILNSSKVSLPLSYQCHNLDTHVQTFQSHNYGKARVEDNYQDSVINNETSDETDLAHSEISTNIEPSALTNDDSRESNDSAAMIINNEPEKIDNIEEIQTSEPDVGALHTFFPKEVSEKNLTFFQKIIVALKKNLVWQSSGQSITKSEKNLLDPGLRKAKIRDKYSIYFPTDVVSYIERKSTTESGHSDWKILVKMALLEVYESDIVNYSAKGTRCNKKTGIDPSVYNAILDWARSRTSEEIQEKDFVYYVNKFIYNKRQYSGGSLSKNEPTTENKGNIQLDNQQKSSIGNTLHNLPENIDEVPLDNMPPKTSTWTINSYHQVAILFKALLKILFVPSENMSPYNFNSTDQVYHNVNKGLDFVPQGRKHPLSVENYENSMDVPPSYVPTYNPHSVNQFQNNSNWSSNYVFPYANGGSFDLMHKSIMSTKELGIIDRTTIQFVTIAKKSLVVQLIWQEDS
ncbi:hypothetical protein KQX54_007100 [Cotesia glomerata]|uniref:Uncharacterized protein n=1 Tax=Cotesia glomerata TaxID=32391 RepID=A0AAV7HU81_COTGL|nr:hypothetical protein KQX54_007100 [Cotesia glomerata]